jgi:hypothetical protein
MRRPALIIAIAIFAAMTALPVGGARAGNTILAADMDIPKPATPPQDTSVHRGPPNCSQWTDDCVNCSRSANGAAPVCSNIGFSCQPKQVRCLQP